MAEERRRIEKSGGSLAYLHGGKPFIRGGDFAERQLKGDRPMQLNYSRAFGGKVRVGEREEEEERRARRWLLAAAVTDPASHAHPSARTPRPCRTSRCSA